MVQNVVKAHEVVGALMRFAVLLVRRGSDTSASHRGFKALTCLHSVHPVLLTVVTSDCTLLGIAGIADSGLLLRDRDTCMTKECPGSSSLRKHTNIAFKIRAGVMLLTRAGRTAGDWYWQLRERSKLFTIHTSIQSWSKVAGIETVLIAPDRYRAALLKY
jgi:hypothetical protein